MTAKPICRLFALAVGSVFLCCGLVSCSSTPKSGYADVVDYTTPQTNLSQEEYPFDEKGNYLADVVSGKRKGSRNKATPAPTLSYVETYEKPPEPTPVVASTANYETPPAPTSDVYAPVYSAGGAGSGSTATRNTTSSSPSRATASSSPTKRSSSSTASRKTTAKSKSTAKSTKTATAKTKAKTKSKPATLRYTVKRGDTLYKLASRYGTSVSAIKRASGLSSDLLRDGRTISIPR